MNKHQIKVNYTLTIDKLSRNDQSDLLMIFIYLFIYLHIYISMDWHLVIALQYFQKRKVVNLYHHQ
ncbi:hypothetical protein CANARDRAFT_97481 [[Candida] arabinofermentans NRRL YB-2248]|uniref:Uncharacterized protein n=1 Tax=[Candida] arabinofermentans NRRL YB-2248 TaxID=983967 RepID=A0A1E4T727_9ASCO|nr:hypothetical protein CANARDRAFT_97481 [[Candida] arabinofermentans NRRL YB-2248]